MRPEDICNINSEAAVIASLIRNPEFYYHSEHLMPNHFSRMDNRLIYTAIQEIVKRDITKVDPLMIQEALESNSATRGLAKELPLDKLNELMDMSDSLARTTVEEYKMLVSNIIDAAFRREAVYRLKDCTALCYNENETNIEKKIYTIIDGLMSEYSYNDEIPKYSDMIDELWTEIKSRQNDQGYTGIPFKFPALNEFVTIEPGELIIFGAEQKVGKSIMLLNCAVDLLKRDKAVLYIDSELSSRLFTARLLSHLTGIEYKRLTSGRYTEREATCIEAAIGWLKTRKFTHIYMPFFDQQTIYTTVKRVYNTQGIDVLVVDYFKSTGDSTDAYATYAEMGKCVDLVKNEIAGAMNIAAIGAAQATASGKLADSAKIARNASTVVMLSNKTQEEMEEDGPECGNKKMVVTVNRNGMQHTNGEYISLQFDGDRISYEQAAKQATPSYYPF